MKQSRDVINLFFFHFFLEYLNQACPTQLIRLNVHIGSFCQVVPKFLPFKNKSSMLHLLR